MSWRWCCCSRLCANIIPDCRPVGSLSVGVEIPVGAFVPDYCSSYGDLSGSYVLTCGGPTVCYSWTYTAGNIFDETVGCCAWWDLKLTAAVTCFKYAPYIGYCQWTLLVEVEKTSGAAKQTWSYGALQKPLIGDSITLTCSAGVNWGTPPVCPAGRWPFDKDSFPGSLELTLDIAP